MVFLAPCIYNYSFSFFSSTLSVKSDHDTVLEKHREGDQKWDRREENIYRMDIKRLEERLQAEREARERLELERQTLRRERERFEEDRERGRGRALGMLVLHLLQFDKCVQI